MYIYIYIYIYIYMYYIHIYIYYIYYLSTLYIYIIQVLFFKWYVYIYIYRGVHTAIHISAMRTIVHGHLSIGSRTSVTHSKAEVQMAINYMIRVRSADRKPFGLALYGDVYSVPILYKWTARDS